MFNKNSNNGLIPHSIPVTGVLRIALVRFFEDEPCNPVEILKWLGTLPKKYEGETDEFWKPHFKPISKRQTQYYLSGALTVIKSFKFCAHTPYESCVRLKSKAESAVLWAKRQVPDVKVNVTKLDVSNIIKDENINKMLTKTSMYKLRISQVEVRKGLSSGLRMPMVELENINEYIDQEIVMDDFRDARIRLLEDMIKGQLEAYNSARSRINNIPKAKKVVEEMGPYTSIFFSFLNPLIDSIIDTKYDKQESLDRVVFHLIKRSQIEAKQITKDLKEIEEFYNYCYFYYLDKYFSVMDDIIAERFAFKLEGIHMQSRALFIKYVESLNEPKTNIVEYDYFKEIEESLAAAEALYNRISRMEVQIKQPNIPELNVIAREKDKYTLPKQAEIVKNFHKAFKLVMPDFDVSDNYTTTCKETNEWQLRRKCEEFDILIEQHNKKLDRYKLDLKHKVVKDNMNTNTCWSNYINGKGNLSEVINRFENLTYNILSVDQTNCAMNCALNGIVLSRHKVGRGTLSRFDWQLFVNYLCCEYRKPQVYTLSKKGKKYLQILLCRNINSEELYKEALTFLKEKVKKDVLFCTEKDITPKDDRWERWKTKPPPESENTRNKLWKLTKELMTKINFDMSHVNFVERLVKNTQRLKKMRDPWIGSYVRTVSMFRL